MSRLAWVATLVAGAAVAQPPSASRAVTEEWGTTLLALGVVTTIGGALGGLRYSDRWASAHGHRATAAERAVGFVLGALGGVTVPALVHLLIVLAQ